ncbi:hypothetical protein AD006_32375 (plasmid) [Pseudonocardia sp. EC080610-09]|nr:hypothetical protein [Pseudonocardia sp. EC080610-09]ALL79929.1 hypothetical protein AD006_32375 [Pseudonocardia sp. EC080610-09]
MQIDGFAADRYRSGDPTAVDAITDLARKELRRNLRRSTHMGADRTYLVSMIVPHGRPDNELRTLVEQAHDQLKPEFVPAGYMAGDFWPNHDTVGLHNDDFRPFTSPVPVLGMRPLVAADLAFFVKHEPTPRARLRYLRYYADVFRGALNDHWSLRLADALAAAERDVSAAEGDPC